MNGSRAKKLRFLAKYEIKRSRFLKPDEKYHIQKHERLKYIDGEPIKVVSLQLWTKGPKAHYKYFKRYYYAQRGIHGPIRTKVTRKYNSGSVANDSESK